MARILVIENDPQIRSSLRGVLESCGHLVEEASSCRSAGRLFDSRPADLVITDLAESGQNSLGLIMQLRLRKPDVKIITMLSGSNQGGTDFVGFSEHLGAIRSLVKPVDPGHLVDAVTELFRPSS